MFIQVNSYFCTHATLEDTFPFNTLCRKLEYMSVGHSVVFATFSNIKKYFSTSLSSHFGTSDRSSNLIFLQDPSLLLWQLCFLSISCNLSPFCSLAKSFCLWNSLSFSSLSYSLCSLHSLSCLSFLCLSASNSIHFNSSSKSDSRPLALMVTFCKFLSVSACNNTAFTSGFALPSNSNSAPNCYATKISFFSVAVMFQLRNSAASKSAILEFCTKVCSGNLHSIFWLYANKIWLGPVGISRQRAPS